MHCLHRLLSHICRDVGTYEEVLEAYHNGLQEILVHQAGVILQ